MDFLGIEIVGAVLGDKQFILAIDAHVPLSRDLVALRVVLGGIGVDVGIANMNGDIVTGVSDSVLVTGFARRSNLNRLVLRRLDIDGAAASSCKKKTKKDRCPRSHGARRRYRRGKVLQRRKDPVIRPEHL